MTQPWCQDCEDFLGRGSDLQRLLQQLGAPRGELVLLIAEKLDEMWLYDMIITYDMVGRMVIYGYTNMN